MVLDGQGCLNSNWHGYKQFMLVQTKCVGGEQCRDNFQLQILSPWPKNTFSKQETVDLNDFSIFVEKSSYEDPLCDWVNRKGLDHFYI